MKYAQVIIGAGYGDEGKGIMTDYFCHNLSSSNPIVIRYNGGSQAGHTVKTSDGKKHVFKHFGSGSLLGIPTFLAKEFIVNPILFNQEYEELDELKICNTMPLVRVHSQCRISTPYDMILNQIIESSRFNKHGSCGVGIFETIKRHEIIPITISNIRSLKLEDFKDLMNRVKDYSYSRLNDLGIELTPEISEQLELDVTTRFIGDIQAFFYRTIESDNRYLTVHNTLIFESAQGLLLSEKHGEMPHLTPSDPGMAIPLEICKEVGIDIINVCYVTRCYTTRHGNGPLFNEKSFEQMELNVVDETNVYNDHQGSFRYAPLDHTSIRRAIYDDFKQTLSYNGIVTQQLAITCIDQLPTFENGLTVSNKAFMNYIRDRIGVHNGYYSIGPTRNDVYKSTEV